MSKKNEIKELIALSPNKDWFQQFSHTLNYSHLGFSKTFLGAYNLFEFVYDQAEGYTKMENLPAEFKNCAAKFRTVKDSIISLITNNNVNIQAWRSNLEPLSINRPLIFFYNSPETEFLINLHKQNTLYYTAARQFFSGSLESLANADYFIGYLMAYEFKTKDSSLLLERSKSEKRSFSKIRTDLEKNAEESQRLFIEFIADAKVQSDEYAEQITTVKSQKEEEFTNWFGITSKTYSQFKTAADTKILELENLYREKLKLEAPAQYWSARAKSLRKEGYWWLGGLILTIIVGIVILIWTLNEISVGTLDKIFQNSGTAIKWSVLYITLVSFLAYAIKIFSKLSFSSFHLVRDAEEREQLTYVYLALQKEKSIDETERHLIMQSLFSRADTGLLKDEGSPTMPGSIADKIISK